MGESINPRATLRFDRRVRLEFRGATITSDAGLLACRELDDALGLTETANECLQESWGGRNVQHRLVGDGTPGRDGADRGPLPAGPPPRPGHPHECPESGR